MVHGRTKTGGFSAPVDYDAIGEIKAALSIPVIANGDIDSYEKAKAVLESTGADGVMIGRGAIGKPWIFAQLKNDMAEIDEALKRDVVLDHFDNMIHFHREYGAVLFRKHLHNYSKGIAGASEFRDRVNRMDDPLQMRREIEVFFSQPLKATA